MDTPVLSTGPDVSLRRSASRDITQPCIRLQRRLGKSPRWAERKDRQYSNNCIYKVMRYEINPPQREIRWHSSRITVETGLNDRGQHAHGARKNKERRTRRLCCAKLSATQPKPRQMTSKANGTVGWDCAGVSRSSYCWLRCPGGSAASEGRVCFMD